MDTKVNKACSYSQRVHCVVKEMNGPKETSKCGEDSNGSKYRDCKGGKLKEEKMANMEAFLELSLSEVSKMKKERKGSPRKMKLHVQRQTQNMASQCFWKAKFKMDLEGSQVCRWRWMTVYVNKGPWDSG